MSKKSVFIPGLQYDITKWADNAFGSVENPSSIVARANIEMAELLMIAQTTEDKEQMMEESADVVICLYRFVNYIGGDLDKAIQEKMEKNKKRKWKLDGFGHGQHKTH